MAPEYNHFVQQGMRRGGIAGGLAGTAIGGIAGGLAGGLPDPRTGKTREPTTSERVINAIGGGLSGGYLGHALGQGIGGMRSRVNWKTRSTPEWLRGIKTRAEGRKRYHQESRKVHPDFGGSAEAQSRLNQEWEKHEPMLKSAMLRGFSDELEKIANARGHAAW